MDWMSWGQENVAAEPRCVPLNEEAEALTFLTISAMHPDERIAEQVPSSSRPETMMDAGTMMQPV